MPDQSPLGSHSPSTPGNSGTPQPGSARSSISSRACDACRGRRRKCHFDDASSPNANAAAPGPSQPQPQCYNCRRLGIVCSFLLPSRPRGPKRRCVSQSRVVVWGSGNPNASFLLTMCFGSAGNTSQKICWTETTVSSRMSAPSIGSRQRPNIRLHLLPATLLLTSSCPAMCFLSQGLRRPNLPSRPLAQ